MPPSCGNDFSTSDLFIPFILLKSNRHFFTQLIRASCSDVLAADCPYTAHSPIAMKIPINTEKHLFIYIHSANVSGHRRRLVADSLKRLVQLLHSAWSRRLSLENWCFGSENGLFFGFEGYFEVFWAIWGCKTGVITHFLTLSLHLCTGVEVLGITPHLLNVRVQATAHGQYDIRL